MNQLITDFASRDVATFTPQQQEIIQIINYAVITSVLAGILIYQYLKQQEQLSPWY